MKRNMPDWLKDWRSVVLYAFCTAVIFFLLYFLFVPSRESRYVVIAWYDKAKTIPVWYMDTVTGKRYHVKSGKLLSAPHDN